MRAKGILDAISDSGSIVIQFFVVARIAMMKHILLSNYFHFIWDLVIVIILDSAIVIIKDLIPGMESVLSQNICIFSKH